MHISINSVLWGARPGFSAARAMIYSLFMNAKMLRSHFARESGRDGKIIHPPSRQQRKKSIRTENECWSSLREQVFYVRDPPGALTLDRFFIISAVLISDYIVRVRVCVCVVWRRMCRESIHTRSQMCSVCLLILKLRAPHSLALDRRLWCWFRISPVATRQFNCLHAIVQPWCCFEVKGWKISLHHPPKICLLGEYFQLLTFTWD
jgi:hypothetical protein